MNRLAAVLAAIAVVSTACGAGGAAPPASTRGPSEQLLTEADVGRYAPGSPPRALLDWWRNAQFANMTAFLNGFEESLRRSLAESPKTIDALNYFAGAIRTARPTILNVDRKGATATVYTLLVYRRPLGTRRYVIDTSPRAFAMTRQDGSWRLLDDAFVESTLSPELRRAPGAVSQASTATRATVRTQAKAYG